MIKKQTKKNKKIYIHYGNSIFAPELLAHSNKSHHIPQKPNGIWASPLYCGHSWKKWCESNDYKTAFLRKSFKFRLSKNAKILHVYRPKDLKGYLKIGHYTNFFLECLDLKKIYTEFDGMEVHWSNDTRNMRNNRILEFWDVDSICIWNPDIVLPIA